MPSNGNDSNEEAAIMNYELLREWVRAEIDYSCADGSTNKERDIADRLFDELKATNNAKRTS